MIVHTTLDGNNARLTLEGRFDFNANKDFRDAYESVVANPAVSVIELSFTRVDYLDSSALGMLLLLKDKADAAHKRVELSGTQGTVRQVFEIANFQKLFTFR